MAIAHDITLTMMLAEQKRLYGIMKKNYPQQVTDGKLTPYDRDHRYRCAERMIGLLEKAIENKQVPGSPKFYQILNQQQP